VATTSGRGYLLLGDAEGSIFQVDRTFQFASFEAYSQNVSHLLQLKEHNILISVGNDEEGGMVPLIKICT
jgi:hypothetical protein